MAKRRILKAVMRDGKFVVLGGPSDVPQRETTKTGIIDKVKRLWRKK